MDVRSEEEHEKNNLGGIHVPLYEIDEWMKNNETPQNLLMYCNSGTTAKQAALLISKNKNLVVYFLDAALNAVMNS